MLNFIFNFYENKLIENLSKSSVKNVLEKMSDNNYYFPYNIWKKYFDKNSIEGGKQISWFAYREIEKINNINEFEFLKNICENQNSSKELINHSLFALGHLSKNTKSKSVFEYLMDKIKTENNENKETILIAVTNCEKPKDYNLEPIYDILKNARVGLKTSAAISLKKSESTESEKKLIEALSLEKNSHFQQMTASTLRDIGTEISLPILKEMLKTGKGRDYKYFFNSAIEEIERRKLPLTGVLCNRGFRG